MSTQRIDLFFTKSNISGGIDYITGATGTATIVRLADGYTYDNDTSAFVESGATLPTLAENATFSGLYSATFTVTAWNNGTYLIRAGATKTGENPISYQETWVVTDGVATDASTAGEAAADYCRVYLYLTDKPTVIPTDLTCTYISTGTTTTSAIPLSVTGTYSSGTGLVYWDVLQSSTCKIKSISRGICKSFVAPELSTLAYPSVKELV